jgi:hypothetical protein
MKEFVDVMIAETQTLKDLGSTAIPGLIVLATDTVFM